MPGRARRLGVDTSTGLLLLSDTDFANIEQIAREHRSRHAEPVDSGARAVDLIRAERDAR